MLTFDLENKVKNILYRQIATETITIEQAEILKERLGNLAFNLFSANHKKVIGLNLAISWLFDPRTEVLDKVIYEKESLTVIDDLPLRFTPQEQILATWLLTTAVQMGFLIEENDGFYFPDDNLQDYFCAIYCMKQPISNNLLNRTQPNTWYIWSDIDLFLPDKVWQFIKDKKEDEEYNASSLLGTIGEFSLRKDKTIWSKITEEHIVTLLIEGLQDSDSDVRRNATSILSGMLNSRIIEPFLKALQDINPEVRAYAASGLGILEEKRATPELVRMLADNNEFVRQQAIYALSYIANPETVEPLINTLKYDVEVDYIAASVLGGFRDRRAVKPLIEALDDDNEALRAAAAKSLGDIGDKQAIDPLASALNDEDEKVRTMAAYGLGMLGDSRGFDILVKNLIDPKISRVNQLRVWQAAKALGELRDKRAVRYLINALENRFPINRKHIAEALSKIEDPRSKETLVDLLRDEDADVRASAVIGLGKIGDLNDTKLLKAFAEKDEAVTSEGVKIKNIAFSALNQILLTRLSDNKYFMSRFDKN